VTTLKEKKSIKKPLSEEAKKERAAKARATRIRHKMESLYSEYLVDLSIEEKTMWDQTSEKEKEATVLQWDRLKKNEKKQQSCSPICCHGNGGGEPPTTKKKILRTLQQSMTSTKVETTTPRPKY
jgi:hypothetical protein